MHIGELQLPVQMKGALLSCALLLLAIPSICQKNAIDEVLEYISSQISDEQELDMSLLYEDLRHLHENPIDLNNVSKEQLDKLVFLTDVQIENILFYQYQYGEIYTIHELHLIDGLDNSTIQLLQPFVRILPKHATSPPFRPKELFTYGKHEILWRMDSQFEKKEGFNRTSHELKENPTKHYLGDPFYTSLKYNFRSKDRLLFGFSGEKDAGEQFWGTHNKGFDFYNAHLQINDLWKFKTIVAGDYRAVFGQGLVMRSEFKVPNASVLHTTPRNTGLRKSSSTDEYNFLRGVGASIDLKKFRLSLFYSYRKMDTDTAGGSFQNLKTDGLHRKISELEKKRTLPTQTIGGNLSFVHSKFRIGITSSTVLFKLPRIPGNKPYSRMLFSGKIQSALGLDYQFRLFRFNFFGETAVCSNKGAATINGVFFTPASSVGITFLHRYYAPKYDVLYANGFGNSNTINENGFYAGMEIQVAKHWKLAGSGDACKNPWISYNASKASVNYRLLLRVEYNPNPLIKSYLQLNFNEEEKNWHNGTNIPTIIGIEKKLRLTASASYKIKDVQFKSQITANFAKTETEESTSGFLIFQDVSYLIPVVSISINARYAYFDAANYANRFSVYESDIPFTFSIPMLYGKGCRYYLNLGYNALDMFSIWVKFAQTYYTDNRTFIGSDWDKIEGNRKSDFRIQIRFRL